MTDVARKIALVNPMASRRPTGMGGAGFGLCDAFGATGINSASYCWINDRVTSRLLRIILRWMLSEIVAVGRQSDVVIYATHHGPILAVAPRVVVVHDLICINNFWQSPVQAICFCVFAPVVSVTSAAVVSISRHAAVEWNKRFGFIRRVDAVIPSISRSLTHMATSLLTLAERRALGQILFVGGNYRHKSLDYAINVVRAARGRGLPVNMLVVGTDWSVWRSIVGAEINELAEEGIVIEQYCSLERLRDEYQRSLCLFFPSREEGLGFPPLEAAACGCPVICNRIPVLLEVAGPFADFVDTGNVAEGVDAVRRLFCEELDSTLHSRLEAGRLWSEKFKANHILEKWKQLLASLPLSPQVI